MYGLTRTELHTLNDIIQNYHSDLEWVKLFGSRTNGTFKKHSDIDLAIRQTHYVLSDMKSKFEESSLPYTIDIIDYDRSSNKNLKNEINKHGKFIYISETLGADSTNIVLMHKLKNFQNAFERLKLAMNSNPHKDSLYLDAIIQRFEFTFELSWRLMRAYLSSQGIESNSPRSSFQEAFKIELIDEIDDWLNMIATRNRTSQAYNENVAWDIRQLIEDTYLRLFERFLKSIMMLCGRLSEHQ